MRGLHYALISSVASIGCATFGSFDIGEYNAITTIFCVFTFGVSFMKYLSLNKNVEE